MGLAFLEKWKAEKQQTGAELRRQYLAMIRTAATRDLNATEEKKLAGICEQLQVEPEKVESDIDAVQTHERLSTLAAKIDERTETVRKASAALQTYGQESERITAERQRKARELSDALHVAQLDAQQARECAAHLKTLEAEHAELFVK